MKYVISKPVVELSASVDQVLDVLQAEILVKVSESDLNPAAIRNTIFTSLALWWLVFKVIS